MKSRILNVSPRAYLRDLDSENVLPPIVRTGYNRSLGVEPSTPFDDTTTILNNNQIMLAPYMVTASLASFNTGTLYITSSFKDRSAYLSKPVINDPIAPYQESFNTSPFSIGTSRNTGFPGEIYPGFTSSAENRLAIRINITPTADFTNTRISRDDSLLDPAGEFYDNPRSGFIYYNFANQQWDSIGLYDPVTGGDLNYTSQLTSSSGRITGGNQRIMTQFCSTPGVAYKVSGTVPDRMSEVINTANELQSYGYDFIGYPTSFFEAPYAPRYHATKDQVLKLSNYIKHPIVCDRIQVSLPITFRRIQDPNSAADADFGFAHDVNNHTFFLYIQRRSQATVDSVADVSSSIRYLIANKSFQSVNYLAFASGLQSRIQSGDIRLGDTDDSLSAKSSLARRQATLAGQRVVQSGRFQVNMSFRPRVYDQFYGSVSRLSAFNNTSTDSEVLVRNFWRGGQYASGSTNAISRWSSFTPTFNSMSGYQTGSQTADGTSILSGRSIVRSSWLARTGSFTISGSFALFAGNFQSTSKYNTSFGDDYPFTETPVVLYPEDELIIGIDSGVYPILTSLSPTDGGVDSSVLGVTGSNVTLRAAPAQVILFGTQVREDHEIPAMLNQHLGSAAVSEDIHFNNVITDQFDMLPRISLSSSYVDRMIARNISSDVIASSTGSFVHFTRWSPYPFPQFQRSYWNGALQRNLRLSEDNVVFYDTMTPEPSAIVAGIVSSSIAFPSASCVDITTGDDRPVYNNTAVFNYTYVGSSAIFPFTNARPNNVLTRRAFTYETSTPTTKRFRQINVAVESAFSLLLGGSDNFARFLLYYNGYETPETATLTALLPASYGKNYNGAASLRYGYMNPRLTGPSWVFRRDRYGQVRDMLEQSRNAKVHYIDDLGIPHVSRSPVLATFVSASSDIVVDGTATQCSNLSIECTSSIPFTDTYVVRNRSVTLPAYTAKFGVNNLIFGVTGSSRLQ